MLPLMLGACWEKGQNIGQDSDSDSTWVDSCVYDKRDTIAAVPDSLEGGLPQSNVYILVETPSMEKDVCATVEGQLASILSGKKCTTLPDAVQNLGDSVRNDYRKNLEELYCDTTYAMTFAYTYTYDNQMRLADSTRQEVVGYEGTLVTYQGGAHGGYSQMLLNFSRQDGHLISAAEAFDAARTEDLLQLIRQQICDDRGCKTQEELQEQYGLLVLGDVYVSDTNFLLLQGGVRFHYDPYDIGPWAAGEVEVTIPYDKLGDIFIAF